jgi:hypothetical protein
MATKEGMVETRDGPMGGSTTRIEGTWLQCSLGNNKTTTKNEKKIPWNSSKKSFILN